ncbi:NUDIX hydrolase [Mangrovicella endophytica]|uniref:NUDIX hydrolase n=1 Tax=Mangrovicella endophytica TaxID=2066697 RepID=UPI001FE18415|nr:NAD regulator [Mangrovicella endophytica]
MAPRTVEVGLNAAIVAVADGTPLVLVTPAEDGVADGAEGLPFGAFDPLLHRTFESGLRSLVGEQTSHALGYVEQLYTFGDRGRLAAPGDEEAHIVSVGYLALTRIEDSDGEPRETTDAAWQSFYRYFPWEDWRAGKPEMIDATILPKLGDWAAGTGSSAARTERLRLAFGASGLPWDEERVLERYELLYEAGLIEEAVRDGRLPAVRSELPLGRSMQFDHRRILATAIARLRSKLKYRPVIFELMPATFTLSELQRVVEAIAGRHLHTQNFRRFVENTALVEATGGSSARTGGRPAALFRFRKEVLSERPSPGIRIGRA